MTAQTAKRSDAGRMRSPVGDGVVPGRALVMVFIRLLSVSLSFCPSRLVIWRRQDIKWGRVTWQGDRTSATRLAPSGPCAPSALSRAVQRGTNTRAAPAVQWMHILPGPSVALQHGNIVGQGGLICLLDACLANGILLCLPEISGIHNRHRTRELVLLIHPSHDFVDYHKVFISVAISSTCSQAAKVHMEKSNRMDARRHLWTEIIPPQPQSRCSQYTPSGKPPS